jgi:protein-tyrosine phosphatase
MQRVLELEGSYNFRDLGGYRTRDGRTVKWRQLFRSGNMSGIAEASHPLLSTLGIRTICDLRSNVERQRFPTQWHQGFDSIQYWYRDHLSASGDLVTRAIANELTAEEMRDFMLQLYRDLPFEQAASYKELFRRVADGDFPLIFNCAAGKDRTGVAAALLLSALEVSRTDIIRDYIMSEALLMARSAAMFDELTGPWRELKKIPPVILQPMLRADRRYIGEMFEHLEERYASVPAYLQKVLQISSSELNAVREQLLIPSISQRE